VVKFPRGRGPEGDESGREFIPFELLGQHQPAQYIPTLRVNRRKQISKFDVVH